MDSNVTTLDELLAHDALGTKISIYLQRSTSESEAKVFAGMREQALRLLDGAGDRVLSEEFRSWSGRIFTALEKFPARKTAALFFSGSFRKLLFFEQDLPPRVVVSDSFHIKPLLFAKSETLRGYLVEFHRSGATLWESDGGELSVVEYFEAPLTDPNWPQRTRRKTLMDFLHNLAVTLPTDAYVQICGAPEGIARSQRFWSDYVTDPFVDACPFGHEEREEARMKFLSRLKLRYLERLSMDITERLRSPEASLTPEEALRRIKENRVSQLHVSLEALRWGTIDRETGIISYRRMQTDHRDEDVLDDIAELALKNGVAVKVVKQISLPRKVEIVAS